MAKPTARIRGNRRVGAGFRLSVAIATSAALWLGERAADGKSLVRTIIPRVAILQSGPSRSVVLHPRLHTSRCFRLSLRHVFPFVPSRAKNLSLHRRFFALYDVTILAECLLLTLHSKRFSGPITYEFFRNLLLVKR